MHSSGERMIEAAIAIIEIDGEAGVRVDRIAETAGIAKPSLYHFFKNRDGLIIAAQAERYRRSLQFSLVALNETVRACRSQDEFKMLIRNQIRSFALEEGKRRRRVRIQVLGSAASRPTLRAEIQVAENRSISDFEKVFGVARDRGWITSRFDLETIARWWFGVILGRHLIDDHPDEEISEQWTDITLEAVEHVLYGTPAS